MADLVKGLKVKGEQKTKPKPLETMNEEALFTQYRDTLSQIQLERAEKDEMKKTRGLSERQPKAGGEKKEMSEV